MTTTGTRLGAYRLDSLLGRGGMGEVWRATDTRLGRTVAIKIIAAGLLGDVRVQSRFNLEARAISSITHPNVCALFDIGTEEGVEFIVMEYIEGETLARRILRGPLPIQQALMIGSELGAALEQAHRRSIVHRDLKPGNVMLTRSGAKLLDFGLAHFIRGTEDAASTGMTHSLTAQGTVVGTLQYMAPEQVEGRAVDHRTDVFALGSVLYEMLAGRPAFEGATRSAVANAIVSEEPRALPKSVPPGIVHLVQRCLEKDPDSRFQNAGDVAAELRWLHGHAGHTAADKTPRRHVLRFTAALVTVAVLAFAASWALKEANPPGRPVYASLLPPPGTTFLPNSFEVSPDGRRVVFTARNAEGQLSLWIRRFDQPFATKLAGTDFGRNPFWSPDSSTIGFQSSGAIRKVGIAGTPPEAVCPISFMFMSSGSWSRDGVIVFSGITNDGVNGIWRVAAAGGSPQPLSGLPGRADAVAYSAVHFLPDSDDFTFIATEDRTSTAWRSSLTSKPVQLFAADSAVHYTEGRFVFQRGGVLLHQPFDLRRRVLSGTAVAFERGVRAFSLGGNGVFAYQAGASAGSRQDSETSRLAWFDRSGTKLAVVGAANPSSPRLSPDGTKLAMYVDDALWISNPQGGSMRRLTSANLSGMARWSRDSQSMLATFRGAGTLSRISIVDAGEETVARTSPEDRSSELSDVSPDGRFALLFRIVPGRFGDIYVLDLTDGTTFPLVATPGWDYDAQFSPDGRHVVYVTPDLPAFASSVYVCDFPAARVQSRISAAGGKMPRWRGDGKEILYQQPDGMIMSVAVRAGLPIEFEQPRPLFRARMVAAHWRQFDVVPGGERIILNEAVPDETPITIVTNWRLPVG